jgi:hypothetical protein
MEVTGQRQVPTVFYPPERTPPHPRYPLDRRLGGPQSWSGHRSWRKILCVCRGSNPGRPVCRQTLYWQNYPRKWTIRFFTICIFSTMHYLVLYAISPRFNKNSLNSVSVGNVIKCQTCLLHYWVQRVLVGRGNLTTVQLTPWCSSSLRT